MHTIWKFSVPVDDGVHLIQVPGHGRVVHAECHQRALVTFWIEVPDANEEPTPRAFTVVGTGHDIDRPTVGAHRATVIDGPFVWHLIEQTP